MTDHQTLIDLNIIPGNASAFSLKEKLDYCQTQGGKDYLKELLKLKNITYTEILERQSCIKFICHQPAKWRMPVSEDEIFYLKQYLNSTYEPLTGRSKVKTVFISIKRLLFNREQYYFTLSGIKGALRVLQEIVLFCRTVYDPLMPGSLKEKLQVVQEASASMGIGERIYTRFLHEEPNPAEVFTLDHTLRTKHRDKIADILAIYYQLEVYYSLARANVSMKLTFPELADGGADISLKELFHPLVEGCSSNTIHTDGRNMIIITGPNMSGKSTFMKSVGIAFVMAYLGMGVPAAAAIIPVVDVMITCIDIKDDIEKGYSYFSAK